MVLENTERTLPGHSRCPFPAGLEALAGCAARSSFRNAAHLEESLFWELDDCLLAPLWPRGAETGLDGPDAFGLRVCPCAARGPAAALSCTATCFYHVLAIYFDAKPLSSCPVLCRAALVAGRLCWR